MTSFIKRNHEKFLAKFGNMTYLDRMKEPAKVRAIWADDAGGNCLVLEEKGERPTIAVQPLAFTDFFDDGSFCIQYQVILWTKFLEQQNRIVEQCILLHDGDTTVLHGVAFGASLPIFEDKGAGRIEAKIHKAQMVYNVAVEQEQEQELEESDE